MQNINFHIAYLLTKHECVIIPGFGAFVASAVEKSKIKETGLLCPPIQPLGFNPEIKHNDGLLANSISKEENISYKEACLRIQEYVDYLNNRLNEQKTIQIQWVGKLALSAKRKIIFAPSLYLSCNASHFGLSNFYLPTLKELEGSAEPVYEKKEKQDLIYIPLSRNIAWWAGSIAAAILALFVVSTPLNEHSTAHLQQAGFLPVSTKTVETSRTVEESTVTYQSSPVVPKVSPPDEVKKSEVRRYYHIIIASLPAENSAKDKLSELQRKSFPNASLVSAKNRYRIAVNKFENKSEAEAFLKKFRAEHPEHADAWLLSQ
jgi:nucleoid DNA-binding protein